MPLLPGTRLDQYEVIAPLGAGGMGEVYRARDTKLQRDVALKILPELFATDRERLSRFQREAQVLASLNHPHIAAIYGLEESNGVHALVLELVDGPTLAERIARGPIPPEEVLPIARQITEAIEAAHERGIVHRDLKPANIKLRPDGVVKVLDFGLAKALDPGPGPIDVSQLTTITSPAMTQLGVILGTAAYMSPEQAKGRVANKRSDIWAFGCLLFEMLSGHRVFGGEDVAETLAYILTKEPDWALLPPQTPASVRRVLRRCLEKDGARRLADIADVRLEIDDAATDGSLTGAATALSSSSIASQMSSWRRFLPWALSGLCVATATIALWSPWRTERIAQPMKLRLDLGADLDLVPRLGPAVILSPAGTELAFVARAADQEQRLYFRPLDQLDATLFLGTEGASDPFFSPDGKWIAFFAEGKLKKVETRGGAPVVLCNAPSPRGGSWGEDGTIVFAPERKGPLFHVSSTGGTPQPLTTLDKDKREGTHRWPQVLPGAKAVLYSSPGLRSSYGDTKTMVYSLSARTHKEVQVGGMYGRYVAAAAGPIGYLAYVHGGTLFAAPFDLDKLEMTAEPVPILEEVVFNYGTAAAQLDFSRTGALVFLRGKGMGEDAPLQWLDAQGKLEPLRSTPASYGYPRFSPAGERLAVTIFDGPNTDIWIYDWARDSMARLTSDPAIDDAPVWTPDGQRIAFRSMRGDGPPNIYWQRAEGTGTIERLTASKNQQTPESWTPDGKTLAYSESDPETQGDIWLLPLEGDERAGWKPGSPRVFLNSAFLEGSAAFSPDGRWLAYNSDETGTTEVFVRPLAGPSGKWQISSGGGFFPRWSPNGSELFYAVPTGLERGDPTCYIMVANCRVKGSAFQADKPRTWTETRFKFIGPRPTFDLHPDGRRVVVLKPEENERQPDIKQVTLILGFSEELQRRIPNHKKQLP